MAQAPKVTKSAKAASQPYVISAVQVRQTCAFEMTRPPQEVWDLMVRAERTAWALDMFQQAQQNAMQHLLEVTRCWSPLIQFNAQYMIDAIAAVEAQGFYVRTVNNALDNYDEIEISARPFPV